MSRRSFISTAAWITARDLVGGLVLTVALGGAVDQISKVFPFPIRRTLSVLVALAIIGTAGKLWGRHMARLLGATSLSRRGELATALSFSAAAIVVALSLGRWSR